ncbi:Mce protein [Mycobacterium simiae]|uniref:Mce protein n=1 Tax=Mycobacterium simiae TaxID=1784 RepID=A0A5B1BL18_MYCSI|nr:Mce protein [Mycobacterium simiae]KAA1249086.1 Mce protein [Mycobacterium simiae]
MEGDAGAGRLNPIEPDDALSTEVTAPDSVESGAGADQTSSEVTAPDSVESGAGADQTSTEVTAPDSVESGAGADSVEPGDGESPEETVEATPAGLAVVRRPSRLGRRWLVGVSAALVLLAGGVGAGGYLALRSHQESQATARNDAAALQAAKDCVAATQAPDTSAMAASEQKIIDCGTDQYRSQAVLYSSMLVQAYQAANVHVQLSDMRAAVERNNADGSVDVLVALRVKMSNDQAQNQETGYRLRVRMAPAEGQYKIARLDQVTK